MTIREAQCIIAAAKYESITKAAQDVFVTQSALSKTIDHVEKILGVKLFDRNTSGIKVSDVGSRIVPVLESMIGSYEAHLKIIDEIIKVKEQNISISFEHKYLTALIPVEFLKGYESWTIKREITNNAEKCVENVVSGKSMMAVCHKRDDFGDLEYIPIVDEECQVLMQKEHPLALRKELTLRDLERVPLFEIFPWNRSISRKNQVSPFIKEGFYPRVIFRVDGIDSLVKCVRSSYGVAIVSRQYFSNDFNDIVFIPLRNEDLRMAAGFIIQQSAPGIARYFIQAVLETSKSGG
jgi:DNA-binding transcriptional LysR family regulator